MACASWRPWTCRAAAMSAARPTREGEPMSRVQLSINVSDFDAAVAFYSRLFGVAPAKLRPGYAKLRRGGPAAEAAAAELPRQRTGRHHQPPSRRGRFGLSGWPSGVSAPGWDHLRPPGREPRTCYAPTWRSPSSPGWLLTPCGCLVARRRGRSGSQAGRSKKDGEPGPGSHAAAQASQVQSARSYHNLQIRRRVQDGWQVHRNPYPEVSIC